MSFLPPVVMEIRANAAQFLSEQGKVVAAAKATASETEAAAQKEAAAARTAAAEAKRASEQQILAAETSARASTVAADKRIAAEVRATEAQAKAVQMQADSLGVMTASQQAAYDKQVAAAGRAANAVELAAAREAQAQDAAAASATAASAAQVRAAELQIVATERAAAAQEVAATRSKTAMAAVVGMSNKITAVSLLAGAAIAVGATEMAAKFEKSTMLLVTAGGESMGALDGVRKGILDISTSTGTSAEQMSEGMYIMEKAGYRGAAGLAALKASAQGAKDENVDLATMSQAVTDVLLDYGYKMDTVAHATDSSVRVTNMLVAASGAAKTTMQDFAASMAAVIPIGSTAKIGFDQLGGAIATMTQHGQTAQQSSQNLANLVQSFVRPSNMASAAMSQMGIDTTDLAVHLGERGLSGSLKIVSDQILKHMGPDGTILQSTMKENANATAAMQKIIAQMPPDLARMSQGLLDGSVSIKEYSKATKDSGGTAGALGLQLAGLYKANSGVNDSLKAGRPAIETYNAAMRDVFGNVTAARAATMLLMNDSHEFEANIKAIGEAGQKTGQDISTWADMQETLSVQMNQTKQMVANLGIEIGTKLIPVAKDLIGGFTDVFHGFEQGNPVLLSLAALLGGAVTLSVVNFTINMVKAGIATVVQLGEMGAASILMGQKFIAGFLSASAATSSFTGNAGTLGGVLRSGLGPALAGVGIVAGIAAVGLAIISANTVHATVDVEKMTKALVDFADAGNSAGKVELDAQFSNWDTVFGHATSDVTDLDGAIRNFTHLDFNQSVNHWMDDLAGHLNQAKTEAGQTEDKFKSMGDQLGKMVSGGSADTAARVFDKLALSFTNNGKTAQDALDVMPGYKQALNDSAHAAGQNLSQQEMLEFAMGRVPKVMLDAMDSTQKYTDASGHVKAITPDLQKSLEAAGVSADGLVTNVERILPAMQMAGLATESAAKADSKYQEAIEKANGAVADLIKSNVDVSNALTDGAANFNTHSEAGRKLQDTYFGVKDAGDEMAKQAATHGVNAQKDVSAALQNTYDNLVNSGHQMGIVGTHADDLARQVMGIPPGVDIKTWMDSQARAEADKLKGAMDAIDPVKRIQVLIDTYRTDHGTKALNDAQNGGPGGYTGGAVSSIMGMVDGGVIPGTPPSRPNVDNILAMVNGKPLQVRSGEFITNEPQTKANLPWLKASNAGLNIGDAMRSRFAAGYVSGAAQPSAAVAQSVNQGGHGPITINAQTNATAGQISNELSWILRTS
ncbi:phage tail tape measure protein [Pseudarthrobacter sp. S9]|uniref:phage tail tape measure protein n=1 Tax=Pseudarthrobacter sp. S9 TaxID=3418421 RepID=UPI003D0777F8